MRLTFVAALVVILCMGSIAQSPSYPASKGAVSDYAGKLSAAQIAELTSLLRDYERQTSIEFVVIVVDTLQGRTAREYAIGIGDSWGVGKADRNNGIVLLWAPNERAYSLRIADGLVQDLSDADANDITRSELLPNFRREEYYAGLKQTVLGVIQRLGSESWQERMELRRPKPSILAWLVPALLVVLGFSAVVIVAVYRRRKIRQKLQEMAAVPDLVEQNLRVAQQNSAKTQQLLDDFKKEMPEQDIATLNKEVADQPKRIERIKTEISDLNVGDVSLYADILQLKDRAQAEANLIETVRWKLSDVRHAKTQSQLMMQQLSKETFQIADVRDGSKREEVDNMLANSRLMYNRAQQDSSMSVLDWIVINDLLNSSQRQVNQAVEASRAEPYVPSLSYDSTNNGSSTFDTGGIGGGGDFGGGGGFSGGSGSDGSY